MLQRLSSAPIPFTVLSIAGSTCNEDYLAVCGLKVLISISFAAVKDSYIMVILCRGVAVMHFI